ncbi:heme ABC transporter ATP-binding protein [candidate division KSB1 bacterium]|nr:MAG: heme ABC transporter ATP-binding protein [candidate division KSB1 bacterium]
MPSLLEINHLHKRFGSTIALDGVSLSVNAGEIHAVLGENGAGKSTLMNILYGLLQPEAGEMRLAGKPFRPASPADAIRAGIGMIHQHFMLVPDFTVMENFLLGNPRFGVRGAALQQAQTEVLELCRRLSIDISISRPASSRKHPWLGLRQILRMKKKSRGDKNNEAPRSSQHAGFSLNSRIADLSVGQRQRVEIVKTLLRQCRLLILDEPTAVLAPQEVKELFALLQRLREEGYATIFISHKIHEVQAVSDRITVLRNGKVSGAFNTAEASIEMIRRAITPVRQAQGKSPSSAPAAAQTKIVLRVQRLRARGNPGHLALDGLSFELRASEILGVAGVDGNGQAELAEVLLGLRQLEDGKIYFEDQDIDQQISRFGKLTASQKRFVAGFAHIPGDRQQMGLFPELTIAQNAAALAYRAPDFNKHGWLQPAKLREYCQTIVNTFDVRVSNLDLPVTTLSGGNQQKLIVGRELARRPKVLIAVNPTRGVDLSATAKIHQEILAARAQGAGVLLISTELSEIYALSDRIAVLFKGRFAGIFPPEISAEEIGALMLGEVSE